MSFTGAGRFAAAAALPARWRAVAAWFAVAVFLPVFAAAAAQPSSCARETARLILSSGAAVDVTVEIADRPETRAQGLMGRRSLAPRSGMLFIYETPRPASFWMKNTLISLDILFFDARGVLRHVHPRARPLDLTPIPGAASGDPDPDRLLILELAEGEAARLGLVPGTTLMHPLVPQSVAASPCH